MAYVGTFNRTVFLVAFSHLSGKLVLTQGK